MVTVLTLNPIKVVEGFKGVEQTVVGEGVEIRDRWRLDKTLVYHTSETQIEERGTYYVNLK